MDTEIENEVKESTETNEPSEIDTSWIDSFSDKDIDNTEPETTETNDKRDRDRDTETTAKEETYSPFDTSYFDNSYDTAPETQSQIVESSNDDTPYVFSDSYVDEANKNMKKWQKMAEENARTGKELAYTNAEVEKQEADALNKALNKANAPSGIFSDVSGALKSLANVPVAAGFDGAAEIQKEFNGLNREQRIEKIARNLAENPDYDVEKVLNALFDNGNLSQTVDAIKDLAKTYETTNEKRADIAANGETATADMSAQQEANKVYQTARENAGITGMERALENYKKAYEANPTDEIAAQIAKIQGQLASASIKVKEEVERVSPNNKKATGIADANIADIYNRANTDETIKKAVEQDNKAKLRDETRPATRPTTPTPAAPTDSSITNEFDEMFANPNTDSLEEYTGKVEEPTTPTTPTAEEPTIDALTRDQADYQRMKAQGWDADRMILDPNTGKLLREPEVDRDKYTPTSSTTQVEGKDSNSTLHNEELNNFLPVEIINTNPENIEGVAEALDNGDTETAEYLLSNSLSANNFLQILDKVSLGSQSISPELLAVIQSMWDKLLAGQSVGKVNASDLSNISREKRDAINKALQNYSETDLKDLGYYSRDTSATNESDYNKGLVENANEVVSDVVKKYIIANPWILQAVSKWSK